MRICVFAGSSAGSKATYRAAAVRLGNLLAMQKIGLVYGGGSVGLMGAIADAVLHSGGEVIGVIPQFLAARELAHTQVSELRIVGSMHERKATMAQLSDGFIAMPGGIGTLDETFEAWTWGQLGQHSKPCALLNTDDYYSPLLSFVDQMVEQGFLKSAAREMLLVEADPEALLQRMRSYVAPGVTKWIQKGEE